MFCENCCTLTWTSWKKNVLLNVFWWAEKVEVNKTSWMIGEGFLKHIKKSSFGPFGPATCWLGRPLSLSGASERQKPFCALRQICTWRPNRRCVWLHTLVCALSVTHRPMWDLYAGSCVAFLQTWLNWAEAESNSQRWSVQTSGSGAQRWTSWQILTMLVCTWSLPFLLSVFHKICKNRQKPFSCSYWAVVCRTLRDNIWIRFGMRYWCSKKSKHWEYHPDSMSTIYLFMFFFFKDFSIFFQR